MAELGAKIVRIDRTGPLLARGLVAIAAGACLAGGADLALTEA